MILKPMIQKISIENINYCCNYNCFIDARPLEWGDSSFCKRVYWQGPLALRKKKRTKAHIKGGEIAGEPSPISRKGVTSSPAVLSSQTIRAFKDNLNLWATSPVARICNHHFTQKEKLLLERERQI